MKNHIITSQDKTATVDDTIDITVGGLTNDIDLMDYWESELLSAQLPLFGTDFINTMGDTITLTGGACSTVSLPSSAPTISLGAVSSTMLAREVENEVVIQRDSQPLHVGEILERICKTMCIPLVSEKELNENPALKAAYEDWQKTLKNDPDVQKAYEKIQLVQNLCQKDLAPKW